MVASIKQARRWLPSTPEGFTSAKKKEIIESLRDACKNNTTCLDGTQPTPSEINVQIATAKRLFEAAETYVKERRAQVTEKIEEAKYVVLSEKDYPTDKGVLTVTIRMYDDGDKNDRYQEWVGRKLNGILSEEEGEGVRLEYEKRMT